MLDSSLSRAQKIAIGAVSFGLALLLAWFNYAALAAETLVDPITVEDADYTYVIELSVPEEEISNRVFAPAQDPHALIIVIGSDYVVAISGEGVDYDLLSYDNFFNLNSVALLKSLKKPPSSITERTYSSAQRSYYIIYVLGADSVYAISRGEVRIYVDGSKEVYSYGSLASDVNARILDVYPSENSTVNSLNVDIRINASNTVYKVVGVIDGSKELVFTKSRSGTWLGSIRLEEGRHSLIVKAYGILGDTAIYGPIEFLVERINTSIELGVEGEAVVGGNIVATVKLVDAKGRPVPNAKIYILLDDENVGETVTGSDGTARIRISLEGVEPGSHTLTAEFRGSDTHKPASKTIEFLVERINNTATVTTTTTTTQTTTTTTTTTVSTTETVTITKTMSQQTTTKTVWQTQTVTITESGGKTEKTETTTTTIVVDKTSQIDINMIIVSIIIGLSIIVAAVLLKKSK